MQKNYLKLRFTALMLFFTLLVFSQQVDTIIHKGIYTSYFSTKLKVPVYVVYRIYQAGGSCKREKLKFYNDLDIPCATTADYAHSGYDKGHLAPAADFSKNCEEEEITFRYYNALPQAPNLNRGIWKKWETKIRKESQTDSIKVICGGVFQGNQAIGNGVAVPTMCWKVTVSLSTKHITHALIFTNTDTAECKAISLEDLETLIGYKIPIAQ